MKQYERTYQVKGIEIKVNYVLGENSKDNHEIIDNADSNDWWFHLSDFPSAHCIIEKEEIDNQDKLYACMLIAEKSKYAKGKNKLKYCYTQVKNIKKTKNPGEVTFLKKPEYIYY